MPFVRLPDDGLDMSATEGESLHDVCERHATSILFHCYSARCGMCRIRVLENPEALGVVDDLEQQLLDEISTGPDERLACQCVVLGDVTIEPAE